MKEKTRKQRYSEIQSVANKDLHTCVIELSEKYLEDFPNSQGVWSMYSVSLYKIDRFKDAKKALNKTLELYEESDDFYSWLLCRMGIIYESSGHFHKAIEWYKKAHNINPTEATFLIYEGRLLLRIEEYEKATDTLIKATECNEGCIDEAFYNLGVVQMAQKKYEAAALCFEKAIEIDPKCKEAKQQLKDVTRVIEIKNNQASLV